MPSLNNSDAVPINQPSTEDTGGFGRLLRWSRSTGRHRCAAGRNVTGPDSQCIYRQLGQKAILFAFTGVSLSWSMAHRSPNGLIHAVAKDPTLH